MPVYEEKLISPLALRFTQEHIKTLFRDRHVVEESTAQIEARPGSGEYDLVLHAPFPQIEIIRWGASAGGEGHWFTLDNRRLYCLQRAAVKHWPQRVAAKVEILYADLGVVRRKYDSSTLGASVTVAHSCKDAPLFRWDWRVEVQSLRPRTELPSWRAALDAVADDDEKEEVDELADVCGGQDSVLARALEYELAQSAAKPDGAQRVGTVRSLTPSTAAASEDSDGSPRRSSQEHAWSFEGARHAEHRLGTGGKRDGRALQATQALLEIIQQLRAPKSDGRLRIPNWNERYGRQLGSLRRFLEARPDDFVVLPEGVGKFRVREVSGDMAAQVVAEIRQQLRSQGGVGNVRIDDWNGQFAPRLGAFTSFVRSHPGEFEIIPSASKFFKVKLTGVNVVTGMA